MLAIDLPLAFVSFRGVLAILKCLDVCVLWSCAVQAFDKSGLKVEFSLSKPDPLDPSKSTISVDFGNTSPEVSIHAFSPK